MFVCGTLIRSNAGNKLAADAGGRLIVMPDQRASNASTRSGDG
jgi:hypothetical protein